MMRCPKCGAENPDNAKVCNSCNCVLISTSTSAPNPHSKTSGLAIASFVLGILSVSIVAAIPAIILGIISLVKITKSAGQLKGKGFAIVGIVIPVVWLPLSLSLLLIPGLSNVKRQAIYTQQMVQFANIDVALELFNNDFDGYPPSYDATVPTGRAYCGAMKLTEAMMGQDMMGFHPDSTFRSDGMDDNGIEKLYKKESAVNRRGPYLPIENANAYRLRDLYKDVGPFDGNEYVVCDVWRNVTDIRTGKRVGMPVLYYKANTSTTAHDISDPDNPENIYNYKDNHALLALGVAGQPGKKHPLFDDPKIFYQMTRNYRVTTQSIPNRADTYILLSAGEDGLYGTEDDIANFDMQWKPE